jgi:TPP-dependent pyruvate/acetoin dehydrogenase alpha subunit
MTALETLTILAPDGSVKGREPKIAPDELLHCYRTMVRVRAFDDVCLKLQRSGRIGFSIPNKGVEACQVGAASALAKTDWIFPSYRDFGMALYHGVTPTSRSPSRSSSFRSVRPWARRFRRLSARLTR